MSRHFIAVLAGTCTYTAVQTSMPRFRSWMENRLRTPDQGADTIVWLCVANQARDQPSGSFFQGTHMQIQCTDMYQLSVQKLG